jgi:outer membrane protein TolC
MIPALLLLPLLAVVAGPAQTSQVPVNPGLQSVPGGSATNQVVRLTLREAIDMAVRYNLGVIEGGENVRIERGQRLRALSSLLPQFGVAGTEDVEQITAATFGIKSAVFPFVIGPFAYSTAQATLAQTLFSFESIQRFRAARTAEQAAGLTYEDILDVVTLIVGNAYLQVIETNSRIAAERAQVNNAQALYKQALDEFQAGTSPRIDVTRTAVQLHTEQYNLSIAENNFAIAKLGLSRGIGLPLGQPFELADQLPYADLNPQSVDEALKSAYAARSDYHAAQDLVKSAQQQLSAARAERYPVLATAGGYGVQGPTFGHSHGIFDVDVGLNIPIFTGGRIRGDITQAEAALRQREAEAENLRGQIDYDVRTAFLNLQAAKEQVTVAHENVDLANESLSRSRERFASGVTDSVEVVQAQQSLASANDQYITGLYSHNIAKLELARALGVARNNYSRYLTGH